MIACFGVDDVRAPTNLKQQAPKYPYIYVSNVFAVYKTDGVDLCSLPAWIRATEKPFARKSAATPSVGTASSISQMTTSKGFCGS